MITSTAQMRKSRIKQALDNLLPSRKIFHPKPLESATDTSWWLLSSSVAAEQKESVGLAEQTPNVPEAESEGLAPKAAGTRTALEVLPVGRQCRGPCRVRTPEAMSSCRQGRQVPPRARWQPWGQAGGAGRRELSL